MRPSVLINGVAASARRVWRYRAEARRETRPKAAVDRPRGAAIPPPLVPVLLDGEEVLLPDGQYVGAGLFLFNGPFIRTSVRLHEPRGLFCAMGVCYECLVCIDGVAEQRACLARVRSGMVIERLGRPGRRADP